MDPYVHGFVAGAITPYDKEVRSVEPFLPNGSDASAHEGVKPSFAQNKHHKHHKHHKRGDIATRKMDSEVSSFANDVLPPAGFDNEIRPDEFGSGWAPNGSNPSAHDGVAFS